MLTMLRASTERGADLVKQILTFARGTEGRRQVLHLPPLVKEVGKLLGQTLPKSITLEVDVPKGKRAVRIPFADIVERDQPARTLLSCPSGRSSDEPNKRRGAFLRTIKARVRRTQRCFVAKWY